MAEKTMKKVMITDTILRDAHQSQAATRMRTDEMVPVLQQLDEIGYYSLEAWGGATFDTCLRFLNEDPWERLRTLKRYLKKTPIQMLLRGQNLLGYRHYSDDVVEKFVAKSIENGVGIVRVFDALNDPRNLETSMKAIKKYGGVCEAAISYTTSPVHTTEYFVKLAKQLEGMGADNICIKDMANLLLPYTAYDLVSRLKAELKPETKVHLHTHNTTGTGDMTYLRAAQPFRNRCCRRGFEDGEIFVVTGEPVRDFSRVVRRDDDFEVAPRNMAVFQSAHEVAYLCRGFDERCAHVLAYDELRAFAPAFRDFERGGDFGKKREAAFLVAVMVRQHILRRRPLADVVKQGREDRLRRSAARRRRVRYNHRMLEGVALGVVLRRLAFAYERGNLRKFLREQPRGEKRAKITRRRARGERLFKLGEFPLRGLGA